MALKAYCLYTVPVVGCPVIQGTIGKLLEVITLGICTFHALVALVGDVEMSGVI